jgi:hypothetical protein
MFNSTKVGSGSKSLNKTSPGFFLKSPVALALSLVLVAVLILAAWFTVKQRKASNAQGTPAAAVIAPTPPAESSPKTTPAKPTPPPEEDPLYARLAGTIIPTVTFRDVPLKQVLATLADISSTYDPNQKGFNILYLDRGNKNPLISIQVTNMSLDRIFDYIALPKDFEWTVNHGVVEFRPATGRYGVETMVFPVPKDSMEKIRDAVISTSASPAGSDESLIKNYFQKYGVLFEGQWGVGLDYDRGVITVWHTQKNLGRVRDLLLILEGKEPLPASSTPLSAKEPLYARLAATIIPTVTFRDAPLDQVLVALAEFSSTYEPEKKGFNILSIDRENKRPLVSIQVTNLSLDRILDSIAKATDFEWTVYGGVVVFSPNAGPYAPLELKAPSKAKKSKP